MAQRYVPLAFVLSAGLLMGCTIEYSTGAESPPPPPPPPPGQQAQPAPQGAQTAPAKKRRIKSLRHALGGGDKPATDPAAPTPTPNPDPATTAAEGTLVVKVVDGTCELKLDGQSQGTSNSLQKKVAVGTHEVSCTPAGSPEQKHSAAVKANETTTVAFSTKAGEGATVPQ